MLVRKSTYNAGDGAGAVGNGVGAGLGDGVRLVVKGQVGGLRAVGDVFVDDLGHGRDVVVARVRGVLRVVAGGGVLRGVVAAVLGVSGLAAGLDGDGSSESESENLGEHVEKKVYCGFWYEERVSERESLVVRAKDWSEFLWDGRV